MAMPIYWFRFRRMPVVGLVDDDRMRLRFSIPSRAHNVGRFRPIMAMLTALKIIDGLREAKLFYGVNLRCVVNDYMGIELSRVRNISSVLKEAFCAHPK